MKKLLLVLLAFLALLAWLLWSPASPEVISAEKSKRQNAAVIQSDYAGAQSGEIAPTVEEARANRLEFLRGLAQLSNRPIEFFGLVLDQHDNPIPDVKVTLAIRVTKESAPGVIGDSFEYPVVSTDIHGRFAIAGVKGALLSVHNLEKLGYEASKAGINQAFWYWRSSELTFRPDSERPEVFRMWKKAGAEILLRKSVSSPLRVDGTPVIFDLVNGTITRDGDLRVTLLRNPREITYGQRNYEWTLTVESLNGGIIESTDAQMYLAPADGYKAKVVIHMAANDEKWTDEKSLSLYAKLHGGQQYGRIELKAVVGSDRETTPFYLTSFVNPTGSRNLEFDALQNMAKP